MPDIHPLDRPVWTALTTGWAHLAEGNAGALRLDRAYGVFAAARDGSSTSSAALAALVPSCGEVWTVERGMMPEPPRCRLSRSAGCVQMVAETITIGPAPEGEIVALDEADADQMFALATLTRPGPYVRHTNRLGRFIGIRSGDQLVAMAGERMRIPGFAEVSGVCTHPDHRRRGHAATLLRSVARHMLAHGETPFLHSYAENGGAIGLYESLGFQIRCRVVASVLVSAEGVRG